MKKFIITSLILVGCGYQNTELPEGATAVNSEQGVPEAAIDFAAVKTKVFQPFCLRCHSAAGGNKAGVNLETYARVKPIVNNILSMVRSGDMPPAGPIAETWQTLLARWVQAGAPEFASSTTPPTGPNPTEPSPVPTPPSGGDDDDDHHEDCDHHHNLVNLGLRQEFDENFYIEVSNSTLRRRHDDCDDRRGHK